MVSSERIISLGKTGFIFNLSLCLYTVIRKTAQYNEIHRETLALFLSWKKEQNHHQAMLDSPQGIKFQKRSPTKLKVGKPLRGGNLGKETHDFLVRGIIRKPRP